MRHAIPALLVVALLGACGRSADPERQLQEAARLNAPAPGESAMDRPHVVFSSRTLVIDRLGVPVAVPVIVGSTPSPSTLRSDNPSVVEVTRSGALLASRNGTARIETLHGERSSLRVEVRAAEAVEIFPPLVELHPGESSSVEVIDPTSRERLPATLAEWGSSASSVAIVRDGVITAAGRPGGATIIARYGGIEAHTEVVVRRNDARLTVIPEKVRVRIGEVRLFQVTSDQGGLAPRWSARDRRVMAHLGQALFQARSVGRTKVCAAAFEAEGCSDVEVTR